MYFGHQHEDGDLGKESGLAKPAVASSDSIIFEFEGKDGLPDLSYEQREELTN